MALTLSEKPMAFSSVDWEKRIGRRLRLRDLHILSTVVQWGSMAKAAGQLGVSQPSVSEAIANLEAALRVRLLDRSPRGIEPTLYARALLKRGLVVFDELLQGIQDIELLSDPTRGEVRVGCPETLAAGFVPAVIERLSRQHPNVVVHVTHANASNLVLRELRERSIDLMLGRVMGPVLDDELDSEILFEDRDYVVAGARNPWTSRRKVALAELAKDQWIQLPPGSDGGVRMAEAFQAGGLQLPAENVGSYTSSMHIRYHLLATGRFLTILPNSALQFNAKAWSLKALPVDLRIRPSLVAVLTLTNRTISPVAQLFIEHVRAVAKSMSGRRRTSISRR
jgi:DNA-binding transcriptional LysR family regulator